MRFKELADTIVGAGKSKICRQASKLEIQVKVDVTVLEDSLFRKPQSFLLGPSTDWMGPTHNIKDNLHYSKFTDLNVNFI